MLDDPLYIGVPEKRVTGKAYDDLIDEFIHAATQRYLSYLWYIVECFVHYLLFKVPHHFDTYSHTPVRQEPIKPPLLSGNQLLKS